MSVGSFSSVVIRPTYSLTLLILGKDMYSFTVKHNVSCRVFLGVFYQTEEVPSYILLFPLLDLLLSRV